MMKRKRYVIIIAVLAAIFSVSTFFLIRNHIDSKKQAEIYDELIETVEDTDETQETMSYSEDQSFLPDYQELFLQNNDIDFEQFKSLPLCHSHAIVLNGFAERVKERSENNGLSVTITSGMSL